ncbi:MAG: hypothetical protein E7638_05240 [Ruminococcaceae bacterium]|nr:hypothetical protein [Oscillospiraceae bacterium]
MKRFGKIILCTMLAFCTLSAISSCGSVKQKTDDTSSDTSTAETETNTAPDSPVVIPMNGENGMDFIIEFPEGKEITILQITDTQMQELSGARNENRYNQIKNAHFTSDVHDHEIRVWRYMDEGVERAQPDLIVLTGDNIYGELDDDGSMWLELCEHMDSYGIPWLVVFGNHDNESGKGVMWQIEQLKNSEHCVFAEGNVTGNSNYNVVIKQGEEYKYLFYLLDTNGCFVNLNNYGERLMPDNPDIDKIQQSSGIFEDQIAWIRESAQSIFAEYGTLPVMMFYHIPPSESADAANELYPDTYTPEFISSAPFAPDREGDLGFATEPIVGGFYAPDFFAAAKEIGCVGMFMGHQHKVSTSILYDGIRITYGLKTGTYDYHETDMLGTTKITIGEDNSFAVEYLESELEYLG